MLLKPHCIWMIGLSGSGKSTIAKQYEEKYDAKIMSSDKIREELYGDENIQGDPNEVFNLLHQRCCGLLKNGFSIIYDCTNIKRKDRKKFFDYLLQHNIKPIHHAVVMTTPYNICLDNNKKRDRHVPEHVIKRQLYSFNIPFFEEGFDYITLEHWGNDFQLIGPDSQKEYSLEWNENSYDSLLDIMSGFDQKTKHHKFNLGEHCNRVSNVLSQVSDNKSLIWAGKVHDLGKMSTQVLDEDGQAHYYNHAEVGTYKLLQNLDVLDLTEVEVLRCLFYVNYHMYPFSWDSEKTKQKYKKIFGEKNYNDLFLFNYADKASCE